MTSDGIVKVAKISTPSTFIVEEKRHRLPVTCMGFKYDGGASEDSDYVFSGSADYTYNIIYCKGSFTKWLFWLILKAFILFAVLMILTDYL